MQFRLRLGLLAPAIAGLLAGCSGSSGTSGLQNPLFNNPPPSSTTYTQGKVAAIPGVPPTTGTFSFDISYVDPTTGNYYLADRITKGVDVLNASTLQYLFTAGAGKFTGTGTPGPGGSPAVNGGPNGVLTTAGGTIWGGDGDSTLKVMNGASGALVATIPLTNPTTTGNFSFCGAPTTGTANARVDEMAYDPTDNVVMVVNDASCPPFATFVNANPPYNILGSLAFSTANSGAEQPTWDPGQGKFLMALPTTLANPTGELDVIDPKTFKVTTSYAEPNNCQANGTALGPNEVLLLGCAGGPDLVTINATNGNLINVASGQGGADEVYYNPSDNRFYAAASNNTTSARLVVLDSTGKLITYIPGSAGAHSVAAYGNTVFFPQRASGVTTFSHP